MRRKSQNIPTIPKLDQLGVADNTIVIYTSDNGAPFFHWPDGGVGLFRSEKNTNWEGGFRVPFLVRWPARWAGGIVSNDIISMLDWVPTLTEATGIPALQPGRMGKAERAHLNFAMGTGIRPLPILLQLHLI